MRYIICHVGKVVSTVVFWTLVVVSNPTYAQSTISISELLDTRFTTAVMATTYEQCELIPCDDPGGCSAALGANQDDYLIARFNETRDAITHIVEVPCEPGDPTETGVDLLIDISTFHLPMTIQRLRLCTGLEGYIIDGIGESEDLDPYVVTQEIIITSYDQQFTIIIDGISTVVPLEVLLSEIFIAGDYNAPVTIEGFASCGSEQCVTVSTECTAEQLELQEEIVDYLRRHSVSTEDLTYPDTLHLLSLCGGLTLWILDEELDVIEDSGITIIETIVVSDPNTSIEINDPIRSNDIVDNITVTTTDPVCEDPTSGSIFISVTGPGSNLITQYSIDGGETYSDSPLFQGLVDGGYIVHVANADKSFVASYDEVITLQNPCSENDRESCSDGIDNDGDGLVDCEDEDCQVSPDCNPDVYCEVLDVINVTSAGFSTAELRLRNENGEVDYKDLNQGMFVEYVDDIAMARSVINVRHPDFIGNVTDTSIIRLTKLKNSLEDYEQRAFMDMVLVGELSTRKEYALKNESLSVADLKYCTIEPVILKSCDVEVAATSCRIGFDGSQFNIEVSAYDNGRGELYDVKLYRGIRTSKIITSGQIRGGSKKTFQIKSSGGTILIVLSKKGCGNSSTIVNLSSNGGIIKFDLQEGDCIDDLTSEILEKVSCEMIDEEACVNWEFDYEGVTIQDEDCDNRIVSGGIGILTITKDGDVITEQEIKFTINDIDDDGIENHLDYDVDGDGIPNGQDDDVDGDGIPNSEDDDIDGDYTLNDDESSQDAINGTDTEDCNTPGDQDGDGKENCQDEDCQGNMVDEDNDGYWDNCGEENTPELCSDGLDNDGDGYIDCDDLDCQDKSQLKNNICGCAYDAGEQIDIMAAELSKIFDGTQTIEELPDVNIKDILNKLREIENVVQDNYSRCVDSDWQPHDEYSIIPECLWNQNGPYVSYMAGITDGVYGETVGTIDFVGNLPDMLTSLSQTILQLSIAGALGCDPDDLCASESTMDDIYEKLDLQDKELQTWLQEKIQQARSIDDKIVLTTLENRKEGCDKIETIKETVKNVYETINSWEEIKNLAQQVEDKLNDFFENLANGNELEAYQSGKITAQILTLFVGVGEIAKIDKVKEFLNRLRSMSSTQISQIDDFLQLLNRKTLLLETADGRRIHPVYKDNGEIDFWVGDCIPSGAFRDKNPDHLKSFAPCSLIATMISRDRIKLYSGAGTDIFDPAYFKELNKVDISNVTSSKPNLARTKEGLKIDLADVDDIEIRNLREAIMRGEDAAPGSITVDGIVGEVKRGGATERLMDNMFEGQNGYKKYDATYGSNNGFDGLYIRTDPATCNVLTENCNILDIVIGEAKPMQTDGQIFLNEAKDNLPAQMTDEWINYVIGKMRAAGGDLERLSDVLTDNNDLIHKTVALDKETGDLHVINLGEKLNDGPN